MIERLRRLLGELDGDVQWEIRADLDREWQSYHVGRAEEAARTVEDHAWWVQLHHRHAGPDGGESRQGSSSVYLQPWWSDDDLRRSLATTLERAALIHEELRDLLPPAPEYPEVESCACGELENPWDALHQAAGEILTAAETGGVAPSHFELSLRERRSRLVTSAGLDLAGRSSLATLYAVLVAEEEGRKLDFKMEVHRRSLAGLEPGKATREACCFARDSLGAGLPRNGPRAVVVSHSALQFLLDPILAHAGGNLHLQGLSRFRRGEPILPGRVEGDRLTLVSDGLLPMATATRRFSAEGLPAQRHTLVEGGVLRTILCPPSLAGKLDLPVTGGAANLVVPAGTTPLSRLTRSGPTLHVVEFSQFMPDRVTGDMMGEIRLGYEHDGGRVRPVRGGAVSGNLFEAMARMTLSQETVFRGDYSGPAAYRFEGLSVAGQ